MAQVLTELEILVSGSVHENLVRQVLPAVYTSTLVRNEISGSIHVRREDTSCGERYLVIISKRDASE
jgi:hypothetical protein